MGWRRTQTNSKLNVSINHGPIAEFQRDLCGGVSATGKESEKE